MLCNYAHPPPPHQDPSLGTYGMVGGEGGGLQTTPPPLNTSTQDTQHSCKNTYTAARRPPPPSYTQQHTTSLQHYTTTLVYIKLPMYLLFIYRLYLMVVRRATSLLWALEGVGPENLDFFGPLIMLHASKPIRTAPYKQQVH
jgi:hypothetical protein